MKLNHIPSLAFARVHLFKALFAATLVGVFVGMSAGTVRAQWLGVSNGYNQVNSNGYGASYFNSADWTNGVINDTFTGPFFLPTDSGSSAATVSFSSGATTATVTAAELGDLFVGQQIAGTGITPGTYITGINASTDTITLSSATTAASAGTATYILQALTKNGTVSYNATNFGVTNSNTITLSAANAQTLFVGEDISGTNIPTGDYITAINYNGSTYTATLNQAATGTGAGTYSIGYNIALTSGSNQATVASAAQAAQLYVGESITGLGLGTGGISGSDTITAINGTTLTLSSAATATEAAGAATYAGLVTSGGTWVIGLGSGTDTVSGNFSYTDISNGAVAFTPNPTATMNFTSSAPSMTFNTPFTATANVFGSNSRLLTLNYTTTGAPVTLSVNSNLVDIAQGTSSFTTGGDLGNWVLSAGLNLSGSLTKSGGGLLDFQGGNSAPEIITISGSNNPVNVTGGDFRLNFVGNTGNSTSLSPIITGASSYNIYNEGSVLELYPGNAYNATSKQDASGTNLINTAPVNLYGGALYYVGNANEASITNLGLNGNAGQSQGIGAVTVYGRTVLGNGTSTGGTLYMPTLTRANNATVDLVLPVMADRNGVNSIVVTGSDTNITNSMVGGGGSFGSTNMSIVPWITADSAGSTWTTGFQFGDASAWQGNDFVTYVSPSSATTSTGYGALSVALSFASGATSITVSDGIYPSLAVGQTISGTGLSTTISSITENATNHQVTIGLAGSASASSSGNYNIGGVETYANGATTISVGSTLASTLAVGEQLSGTGIAAGTYISQISGGTITLSTATTAASSATAPVVFLPYTNAGFTALISSEYHVASSSATLATAATTDNVNLTASVTSTTSSQTINALKISNVNNILLQLPVVGNLTVTSGAILDAATANSTIGNITLGTISSGSNPFIFSGGGTLNVNSVVANSITNQSTVGLIDAMEPQQGGTTGGGLVLNGSSNSYGGYTEVQGTLTVGAAGAINSSAALAVDFGGTANIGASGSAGIAQAVTGLSGAGTVVLQGTSGGSQLNLASATAPSNNGTNNAVTVNSGGFVTPGDASGAEQTGTLTLGTTTLPANLTFNAASALNINLASATSNSLINLLDGSLTINGGSLNLTLLNGYTPTLGTTWNIIDTTGPIAGTFTTINLAGYSDSIVGDDLVLTYAPEPSTYGMLMLGGLGLLFLRQRRKRSHDLGDGYKS